MFMHSRQTWSETSRKMSYLLLTWLFSAAVFGIWHPTPDGKQALHHESRRVRLRHSEHLPRHHLHLLLLPPNLWDKTRVNHHPTFLTHRQEMHKYSKLGRHGKSLKIFGDCDDSASSCNGFVYVFGGFRLILIRSWKLCEYLVQHTST